MLELEVGVQYKLKLKIYWNGIYYLSSVIKTHIKYTSLVTKQLAANPPGLVLNSVIFKKNLKLRSNVFC